MAAPDKFGPQRSFPPVSTAGHCHDADRGAPLKVTSPPASETGRCGAARASAVVESGNHGAVAQPSGHAGGETPGANSDRRPARPAPRPPALRPVGSSARKGVAPSAASSLGLSPASRAASGGFFGADPLIFRNVTAEDVARACVGALVSVTLPDQGSDLCTMAAANAFCAQLQAGGVCAVSPIGMAARHRYSQIEAGVSLPTPAAAVAAGYGRTLMARSDALAVLCTPGWGDCQRVAVDMAAALAGNRRVFLVSL